MSPAMQQIAGMQQLLHQQHVSIVLSVGFKPDLNENEVGVAEF